MSALGRGTTPHLKVERSYFAMKAATTRTPIMMGAETIMQSCTFVSMSYWFLLCVIWLRSRYYWEAGCLSKILAKEMQTPSQPEHAAIAKGKEAGIK